MLIHAPDIDVDAYLSRIGYRGPRHATTEVLRALHLHHPQSISFENLDPLLHREVLLNPKRLEDKIVHGKRGGYCFEHNLLFARALTAFGFDVTGLAARVLWNQPEDAASPRTHMLLRVCAEGEAFICDVGFGALTLTAPLRLVAMEEQQTPHETFRLVPIESGFRLQARLGENWKTLYAFSLEEFVERDYEISSYYLSTHPASHFRHALIAARPFEGGRYTLSNARLTKYGREGSVESRDLKTAQEIAEVLSSHFLISVPDVGALTAALQRENALPR